MTYGEGESPPLNPKFAPSIPNGEGATCTLGELAKALAGYDCAGDFDADLVIRPRRLQLTNHRNIVEEGAMPNVLANARYCRGLFIFFFVCDVESHKQNAEFSTELLVSCFFSVIAHHALQTSGKNGYCSAGDFFCRTKNTSDDGKDDPRATRRMGILWGLNTSNSWLKFLTM